MTSQTCPRCGDFANADGLCPACAARAQDEGDAPLGAELVGGLVAGLPLSAVSILGRLSLGETLSGAEVAIAALAFPGLMLLVVAPLRRLRRGLIGRPPRPSGRVTVGVLALGVALPLAAVQVAPPMQLPAVGGAWLAVLALRILGDGLVAPRSEVSWGRRVAFAGGMVGLSGAPLLALALILSPLVSFEARWPLAALGAGLGAAYALWAWPIAAALSAAARGQAP